MRRQAQQGDDWKCQCCSSLPCRIALKSDKNLNWEMDGLSSRSTPDGQGVARRLKATVARRKQEISQKTPHSLTCPLRSEGTPAAPWRVP